jgi:hypothetical protein
VVTKLEERARELVEHAMGESWAQKKPLEELLAAAAAQLAREHAEKACFIYAGDDGFDPRHDYRTTANVHEALREAEE